MHISTLLLGIVSMLWSTEIGLEPLKSLSPQDLPPRKSTGEVLKQSPTTLGQIPKPALRLESHQGIDSLQFLEEFQWQAKETGLFGCLNQALPGPKSALFQGIITKSGKMLRPEASIKEAAIPDCAQEAILRMEFPKTAASLTTNSHKIVWRVDW